MRPSRRWVPCYVWLGIMLWAMVILSPKESPTWGEVTQLFWWIPPFMFHKVLHFFSYLILAQLIALGRLNGWRKRFDAASLRTFFIFGLPWCGAFELLQFFNPARTPAWFDVGINFAGLMTGWGLWLLTQRKAMDNG